MNTTNDITKWIQAHLLTVPAFGHAVMVACAIASYENIHDFFKVLHGSDVVAVGLGVAVGAALVMSAGLLAGMGNDWRNPRLRLIATVTTLLALLSGGIQGASYANHGLWWVWASLIGLALPVVGELGIALAVSAYEQEQKARRAAQADDLIEQRINQAIDAAMAGIDVSSAKRHVEKAAERIVKTKMDSLLAKRIGNDLAIGDEPVTKSESETRQSAGNNQTSIAEMNAERQRLVTERRNAIAELFATYGEMNLSEMQARLMDDKNIQASEKTLRTDLGALVDAGSLIKADRGRWDISRPIAIELPSVGVQAINGHHA